MRPIRRSPSEALYVAEGSHFNYQCISLRSVHGRRYEVSLFRVEQVSDTEVVSQCTKCRRMQYFSRLAFPICIAPYRFSDLNEIESETRYSLL